MTKQYPEIQAAADALKKKFETLDDKRSILRAPELRQLYAHIKELPEGERAAFGQAVNELKAEVEQWVNDAVSGVDETVVPIDVTAPFDINAPRDKRPRLLATEQGTRHPITQELERIVDIFSRMGFNAEDSRQLDDEYHMFSSLNFPEGHPARDDYDTFMTDEGLIPPAHTSTMQNRVLKQYEPPIRVVLPGRCYRNEDVDITHEHTFYMVEGVYVDENITVGHMLGAIQAFLEAYFEQSIEFKTQPFYFPFVEPGLEFLIKMPEALRKKGDSEQWLEIMGCGQIHPNVLKEGGIDSSKYSGFAWGVGVDRLVMLKHGIEDIRHFHSGKLEFLRKFQ